MNGARRVVNRVCCDTEDCPFEAGYLVYDRYNKQVGGAWCDGCSQEKVAMLDAYDPPSREGTIP